MKELLDEQEQDEGSPAEAVKDYIGVVRRRSPWRFKNRFTKALYWALWLVLVIVLGLAFIVLSNYGIMVLEDKMETAWNARTPTYSSAGKGEDAVYGNSFEVTENGHTWKISPLAAGDRYVYSSVDSYVSGDITVINLSYFYDNHDGGGEGTGYLRMYISPVEEYDLERDAAEHKAKVISAGDKTGTVYYTKTNNVFYDENGEEITGADNDSFQSLYYDVNFIDDTFRYEIRLYVTSDEKFVTGDCAITKEILNSYGYDGALSTLCGSVELVN
jgi:hypothetical protein